MNMIISFNDFMLRGQLFFRDDVSDRYYRLEEPSGLYSKAAKEGGLVRKRISRARYEKCREECEALTAAENAGRTA
jgi:hypothetical protein